VTYNVSAFRPRGENNVIWENFGMKGGNVGIWAKLVVIGGTLFTIGGFFMLQYLFKMVYVKKVEDQKTNDPVGW
jgi:hypothetical protein